MSDSEDNTDFETYTKRCNYCTTFKKLVFGKPYCVKCKENCFRECRRCHKPYHEEKFFAHDQNRCNSCFNKLQKEREKRQQKREREIENEGSSTSPPSMPTTSKKVCIEKQENNDTLSTFDIGRFLPKCDTSGDVKMGFIPIYFK